MLYSHNLLYSAQKITESSPVVCNFNSSVVLHAHNFPYNLYSFFYCHITNYLKLSYLKHTPLWFHGSAGSAGSQKAEIEVSARLGSELGRINFQTHLSSELSSVPQGCRTEVLVSLLVIAQRLNSAAGGYSNSLSCGPLNAQIQQSFNSFSCSHLPDFLFCQKLQKISSFKGSCD